MSNKKWLNASILIERLKKAYHLKNDAKLAIFLEVKPNTIATWKKRNTIDFPLIFAKCHNLNINWLLTGKGAMFLTESPSGAVDAPSQESHAKEKEFQHLQQEIARLKEELKKIDQEDEKDAAHLQVLENRIRELELKNAELVGQIKLLKEMLGRKPSINSI